jgi:hypothetical protein
MVTLWNDIRLAYGKPPMGFIAPFLYDIYANNPDAFHDIVTGNNVRHDVNDWSLSLSLSLGMWCR